MDKIDNKKNRPHIDEIVKDKYFAQTENLENKKKKIEQSIKLRKTLFPIMVILSILLIGFLIYFPNKDLFYTVLFYSVSLLFFSFYFKPKKEFTYQLAKIDNELDLLNIEHDSPEKRAEKLFKNHQFELKLYYDQTLQHSSYIFIVGVFCIGFGLLIIVFTIGLFVFKKCNLAEDEKIIIAILSGISNILTAFVGTIYLRMFSDIVNSLNKFHDKLVTTHNLHFSNFYLSKIKNPKQKDELIKELSKAIVNK